MLEKKCSIKQAFNQSWDIALGNAGLYAACLFIPGLMISITLLLANYVAGVHEYVMIGAQVVAWLIFSWGLVLRAHLFKTLRAHQAIA